MLIEFTDKNEFETCLSEMDKHGISYRFNTAFSKTLLLVDVKEENLEIFNELFAARFSYQYIF